MSIASRVAATSCVRTMRAPALTAHAASAEPPGSRSRRRPAEHPADRALARDPDEQRRAQGGEVRQILEQRQIILVPLAESQPGIERDGVGRDARGEAGRALLEQEAADLADRVLIVADCPAW